MEENKEKKEKTGFMAQGRSVIIAVIAALSAIICVRRRKSHFLPNVP